MTDYPTYTFTSKVRHCAIYEPKIIGLGDRHQFFVTFDALKMPNELRSIVTGNISNLPSGPICSAKTQQYPYVDLKGGQSDRFEILAKLHNMMPSRRCTLDRFIRGMSVDITVEPFDYVAGKRRGTSLALHGIALDAHVLYERVCS